MGYTHYWYKSPELDQNIWFDFASDFLKVLPHFYKELDTTTDQSFRMNSEYIFFNGIGDNSHETFVFNRKVEPDLEDKTKQIFDCTKTARKPYDIAVCCTLIIAKKHFGADIKVSSDGDNDEEEWQRSKELCQDILKYGENFDIDYENDNGAEFI